MGRKNEEIAEEYKKKKKSDEKIECVAQIDGRPRILLYIAIALISFVIGRIFAGKIVVLMITNILSMIMMVDAARVLVNTQEACLIITNRRIYGKTDREIDCRHREIEGIQNTPSGIFIKTNASHRSVMLRNVKNREEVFRTLSKYNGIL